MKTDIITEFNRIIEQIENRCMATDGRVTPTLREATEKELSSLWKLLNDFKDGKGWIDARKRKPVQNVSVFVFIPGEDDHVTTGMWDVSNKWVLLDEYRVPDQEVTYWHPVIPAPSDKSYTPAPPRPQEKDTTTWKIRELQKKVYEQAKLIAFLSRDKNTL